MPGNKHTSLSERTLVWASEYIIFRGQPGFKSVIALVTLRVSQASNSCSDRVWGPGSLFGRAESPLPSTLDLLFELVPREGFLQISQQDLLLLVTGSLLQQAEASARERGGGECILMNPHSQAGTCPWIVEGGGTIPVLHPLPATWFWAHPVFLSLPNSRDFFFSCCLLQSHVGPKGKNVC